MIRKGTFQLQTHIAMEENKYKGHVVVLPYPCQGHINPLLQFAKRLASKGVKATIATTHYTAKSVNAPNVAVEPISDGFDQGGFAEAKKEDVYLKSFKENGSRTLSQLIHKFKDSDFPVNCVVYDSFLPWALEVARQHGIFGASFFTNSAAICNIFCYIAHGLVSLPLTQEDLPLLLPGLPPLYHQDLPSFLKLQGSNPAYLAMKLNQFSNLDEADWVFGNTFEALESKAAAAIMEAWPGRLIGPMVPSAYLDGRIDDDRGYGASLWKPLSKECLNWLETKPPQSVVYVSYGSMVSLTTEQMEEIAWSLKESNLYFLWVVRETENFKLPQGFVESTSGKGLVVTWCNQLELLSHKATGCFVTHCGWNSILEALSLGVPMVAVPQWADQLTNAKYVDEIWKVGVRPKKDEKGTVRKEEMLKCLNQLMKGKRSLEIKRNARKLKHMAKDAIAEGGSSDQNIDEFVKQLMQSNNDVTRKHLNGYHYVSVSTNQLS